MENLLLQMVAHVEQLGNESELIDFGILAHNQNLHRLIPNLLPHYRPVLIVLLLSPSGFLHVKRHHLLADPD